MLPEPADETGTHRVPQTADETGTHRAPQTADETGTHRAPRIADELDDTSKMRAALKSDGLAPVAVEQVTPGSAATEAGAGEAFDDDEQFDLDSTDRFEVLNDVPDSAYPDDKDDDRDENEDEEDLFVRAMREHDVAPNAGERAASGGHAPVTERTAAAERVVPAERTAPAQDIPLVPPPPPTRRASATAGVHARPGQPVVTPFPRRAASTPGVKVSAPASPRAATGGTPLARAGTRPDAPNWFADAPVRVADDELRPGTTGDDLQPRGTATFWAIGGLVLALALVAQLTHFYRQELVRDPNIGPILRGIYNWIGVPLAPHWDLDAFEVRQWGADDAGSDAGQLTVRASIRNRATFAQPLPLLRLEFEDRFGEALASRDFEPREYLKDPHQATRLLAPNAATEAELVIAGMSKEAVGGGYRLDVCMRDDKLGIRCALSPSR